MVEIIKIIVVILRSRTKSIWISTLFLEFGVRFYSLKSHQVELYMSHQRYMSCYFPFKCNLIEIYRLNIIYIRTFNEMPINYVGRNYEKKISS